jgi:hypothetical protein
MKILVADTQQTINITSVTRSHTVVFLLGDKHPFILVAGNLLNKEGYKFIRLIRSAGARQVGIYPGVTMQACIKKAVDSGCNVQAFAKWQEAFEWLIKHGSN